MFIVAKRDGSSSSNTGGSSADNLVDSAAVVTAVNKLNSIIVELKKKAAGQQSTIAGLSVMMTLFLLGLVATAVIVTLRCFNRNRQSQGLDNIPGTGWCMFPLGPSLNSQRDISGRPATTMTETIGAEVIGNPYSVSRSNGSVDHATTKFGASPASNNSVETFVDAHHDVGASKIDMINSEHYPTLQPLNTSEQSSDSSPNVNRYTIDIEFDPYGRSTPGDMGRADQHYEQEPQDPFTTQVGGNYERKEPEREVYSSVGAYTRKAVMDHAEQVEDCDDFSLDYKPPYTSTSVYKPPVARLSTVSSVYGPNGANFSPDIEVKHYRASH